MRPYVGRIVRNVQRNIAYDFNSQRIYVSAQFIPLLPVYELYELPEEKIALHNRTSEFKHRQLFPEFIRVGKSVESA